MDTREEISVLRARIEELDVLVRQLQDRVESAEHAVRQFTRLVSLIEENALYENALLRQELIG